MDGAFYFETRILKRKDDYYEDFVASIKITHDDLNFVIDGMTRQFLTCACDLPPAAFKSVGHFLDFFIQACIDYDDLSAQDGFSFREQVC
jgi:hypothetical protein